MKFVDVTSVTDDVLYVSLVLLYSTNIANSRRIHYAVDCPIMFEVIRCSLLGDAVASLTIDDFRVFHSIFVRDVAVEVEWDHIMKFFRLRVLQRFVRDITGKRVDPCCLADPSLSNHQNVYLKIYSLIWSRLSRFSYFYAIMYILQPLLHIYNVRTVSLCLSMYVRPR